MKAIHNPQLQTQEWLLSYIASQIYPKFANILCKKLFCYSHVTKSKVYKYLHYEASGSWKYIRAENVLPVILYACRR